MHSIKFTRTSGEFSEIHKLRLSCIKFNVKKDKDNQLTFIDI